MCVLALGRCLQMLDGKTIWKLGSKDGALSHLKVAR